jgi:hypothetical protein
VSAALIQSSLATCKALMPGCESLDASHHIVSIGDESQLDLRSSIVTRGGVHWTKNRTPSDTFHPVRMISKFWSRMAMLSLIKVYI